MTNCRFVVVLTTALALSVAIADALGADVGKRIALGGTAKNGLIAYSSAGNIYTGDPVTGKTTAIVTNPTYEVNPHFSPDGTRIAFMRGYPEHDPSIRVIRPDGTHQRVVMPKGFSKGGAGPFAWTPDGASLVIGHDDEATGYIDGDLSLFDADGKAKPRRFAPPLPSFPGAVAFSPNARVAPMFRPPDGDLILGNQGPNALRVFDARSLKSVGQLARRALKRYEPYFVEQTTWSPNGKRIAFQLYGVGGGNPLHSSVFVMDADGSALLRVDEMHDSLQWSPDGSKIAYDRESGHPNRPTGVIVVADLASGTRRVLKATRAPQKKGSRFRTVTFNMGHTWYHEGWSWSPDGRGLLVLKRHRTRPLVIDIETGRVRKLPWPADSMPSWQPRRR